MSLLIASLLCLMGSGIVSLHPRMGARAGVTGCVIGAALGILAALRVLSGGTALSWRMDWVVPGGSMYLHCDALSAFFLIPILLVSALGAVYGIEYMRGSAPRSHWFFYNFLVAGMASVVLAWNAILFLVAWETMALASFFLVVTDDEQAPVREAGWIYLVATHFGTACLMILFALAGGVSGPLDFDQFASASTGAPAWVLGAIFLLAVAGFGTKAGMVPFHVWLLEAHPAAPSHVSAVMSGVMIKTGIYGIVRVLTSCGVPPLWWGGLLIALGLLSGIGGVLFALAQHDLKRLLAYHSVENIGIILLGLGLGAMGWTLGDNRVCLLGFAGGLLHVLNHGLFKSLLFLGAGAVAHATHTRDLDHLGGLLKRMPHTGGTFLVGSMAISGLPPFNGFISEFLVFLGALIAVMSGDSALCGAGAAVIAGLALISGLAAACFTKAFGSVFLGEPRSGHVNQAHDPGWRMRLPMWVLAGACLAIGLGAGPLTAWGSGYLAALWPDGVIANPALIHTTALLLTRVTAGFALFLTLCGAIALQRALLLRGKSVRQSVTWDCGYASPASSMQYTASSFAQPLTGMFRTLLRTRVLGERPSGLFPGTSHYATDTADVVRAGVFSPLFSGLLRSVSAVRRLQHGNLHLYVLYIALTLLFLLLWELG